MLSTLLFPVFLAGAWSPWILWVYLKLLESPRRGRLAGLAALGALQLSTLGGEVVVQTALVALVLRPPRLARRELLALAVAVALLLAAPVLLGARALLEGTPRGAGFDREAGLSFSAPPLVLLEALLPRFLGDVHTFSDAGYWGQPFFPGGSPFVLSLYLGPCVALLTLFAGRSRLWPLAVLGVLLSLGAHGPLEWLLVPLLRPFRVPVKFFFLTTLAACLLAGRGLDRLLRGEREARPWALAPGAALILAGLVLLVSPEAPARLFGSIAPGTVVYERATPHTLRLRCSGPPGYVVLLEGYHRDWVASGPEGSVPLLEADGRYLAMPTPGGQRVYTLRYEPAWRSSAFALAGLGGLAALGLALSGGTRPAGLSSLSG